MAVASASTKVVVNKVNLELTGEEALTLMALLSGVGGSQRLGTVQDLSGIHQALLDAGVPRQHPIHRFDLGD